MIIKLWIICLAVSLLLNCMCIEGGFLSNVFKRRLSRSRTTKRLATPIVDNLSPSSILVSNISAGELQVVMGKMLLGPSSESSSLGLLTVHDSVVVITPQSSFWKRKRSYTFETSSIYRTSNRNSPYGSGSVVLIGKVPKSANFFGKPNSVKIIAKYVLTPNRLSIEYKVDTDGSRAESKVILAIWMNFLESALRTELGHITARKNLVSSYQAEAETKASERKKRQLDEIIHPEKYRSRRPGSGGSSSGTDGGRYKPSASAQARRQVKGK